MQQIMILKHKTLVKDSTSILDKKNWKDLT